MTQLKLAPRRKPRLPRMTYEEFLLWDGENQHVEWVDGEVIPMAPISGGHNNVGNFLIESLGLFNRHHRLGAIQTDPFQMKTGPDLPGRAPDILFVANRNLRRLHDLYLEGPADLVIEIISPGSRTIDRVHKFREYELGGVREYWLIDPKRNRVEFYRRGRDGLYRAVPVGKDGIFRSAAMKGLWIKVDWLWNPPSPLTLLKEWELI